MIKTLNCIDCRVAFSYDHLKGPTRQRCDACRLIRKAVTDAEKSRRWREANPEKMKQFSREHHQRRKDRPEFRQYKRDSEVRRKYGLEPEQLQAMRDAQGDRCAICKGERCGPGDRLHVDHDHVTGKIRGLLCGRCNTLLGLAGDDPARLTAAAAYIRRHRKEATDG